MAASSSMDVISAPDTVVLTVYFNGSGCGKDEYSLANGLFAATQAEDLSLPMEEEGVLSLEEVEDFSYHSQEKMCFEGSGAKESEDFHQRYEGQKLAEFRGTFGYAIGTMFTFFPYMAFGIGLEAQCKEVVHRVKMLVNHGKKVIVNAYGHSRGAVGCLYVAKLLASLGDRVEVNLALSDPVPGNRIMNAKSDIGGVSWTRKTRDLSECSNLKNVCALYVHEQGEGFMASHFAPLLPQYPAGCTIEETIVLGEHNLLAVDSSIDPEMIGIHMPEATVAFVKVVNFLKKHGTCLLPGLSASSEDSEMTLLVAYEKMVSNYGDLSKGQALQLREAHVVSGRVVISAELNGPNNFVNEEHRSLYEKYKTNKKLPRWVPQRPALDLVASSVFFDPPDFRSPTTIRERAVEPPFQCQTSCLIS